MNMKSSIRYSEAFKIQVVRDLESGKFQSICHVNRAYGIKGSQTVKKWQHLYGNPEHWPKQIKIYEMKEINENQALKQRVKELEKALSTAYIRSVLSESYLEIACERLEEDVECFKKKHVTTLSGDLKLKESNPKTVIASESL